MSPLASVMVLAFLLLIVLSLVVWALLQPRAEPRARPGPEERAAAPHDASLTNDDVRGAKVVPKRPDMTDDAFERFLRADGDHDGR